MKWKRWFWSAAAGLALGTVLARRRPGPKSRSAPEAVPEDITSVEIVSAAFESAGDSDQVFQLLYELTPTPFQLWSLLRGAGESADAQRIYHVHSRRFELSQDPQGELVSEENFYASLDLHASQNGSLIADHLARGAFLEFHKCLVGGGTNGVETGEIIRSPAPIQEYRFVFGGGASEVLA